MDHSPHLKRKQETLPDKDGKVHTKRSRIASLIPEICNGNLKRLKHFGHWKIQSKKWTPN